MLCIFKVSLQKQSIPRNIFPNWNWNLMILALLLYAPLIPPSPHHHPTKRSDRLVSMSEPKSSSCFQMASWFSTVPLIEFNCYCCIDGQLVHFQCCWKGAIILSRYQRLGVKSSLYFVQCSALCNPRRVPESQSPPLWRGTCRSQESWHRVMLFKCFESTKSQCPYYI